MTILPDSPPRFINLNNYLWAEQWLVRYRDMDFIQSVLNGMASRRPRLDALRDSWYDLDAHYDALETRFWQFYPRMMAQASRFFALRSVRAGDYDVINKTDALVDPHRSRNGRQSQNPVRQLPVTFFALPLRDIKQRRRG